MTITKHPSHSRGYYATLYRVARDNKGLKYKEAKINLE